jgi:hypothetical protein
VQLLALARPHLMRAYHNAELWGERSAMLTALEQGLDMLGQHIVVLDTQGRIEFATDGARRLLGHTAASARGLPDQIRAWTKTPATHEQPPNHSYCIGQARRCSCACCQNKRTDQRAVLLLESGTGELNATRFAASGSLHARSRRCA